MFEVGRLFLFIPPKRGVTDAESTKIHLRLAQAQTVVCFAGLLRGGFGFGINFPATDRTDIACVRRHREFGGAAGAGRGIGHPKGVIRREIVLFGQKIPAGEVPIIQVQSPPGSDRNRAHRLRCVHLSRGP